MTHPVGHRAAAWFHLGFTVAYLLAMAFHGASALAHWRER
jgi:hypothetical protein